MNLGVIDILSIDVEGWEIEVLKGLNLTKNRPRVIIMENLNRNPKYHEFMVENNYQLWREIYPNEVWLRAGTV
jgi:hypothetical protein